MARPKKLTEAEKMRDVEAYTHDDKNAPTTRQWVWPNMIRQKKK